MSGRDTASLDTGAGAKAANKNVDDLSEVIHALNKKGHGEFSLISYLRLAVQNNSKKSRRLDASCRLYCRSRRTVRAIRSCSEALPEVTWTRV